MNDTPTPTTPTRWRLVLLALVTSLALIASACGDDDDDGTTAPVAEAADDEMADDDMAEDDMADDDMAEADMADDDMADDMAEEAHEGLEDIWSELAAAGLDDDQITCVLDAAVAEWGADALTAPGQASDEQLLRLGEITFGCA